ncbi:hypothetical protein E4U17_004899 [Claviceps sp. LM77 group G4]|nr:hypothetical protein E4U17_004899 [Claviceps sp. LM77 group G4]KAG6068512.1 hypothetical protein E4U33_005039 [Claviceps sp. LM78 group G4]KAG6073216.1 hypothetical protein E4U16_004826 [Claviceps sp. LM84 group G4]
MLLGQDTDSSTSANLFLLYAAVCLIIHKGKMSTILSEQGHNEPTPPPSWADEKMVEEDEKMVKQDEKMSEQDEEGSHSAPPKPENVQATPRPQSTKQKGSQRGAPMTFQRHASQHYPQRPSQQLPYLSSAPLSPSSILRPRPFEEIYAEQAFLSLTLQSHSSRLSDLVHTFHTVEGESMYGESRKIKRRARRQVGILRTQIKLAAEEEKTIFVRLSDLLTEARSRTALDLARRARSISQGAGRSDALGRGFSQPPVPQPPSSSESRLNGASAEFIPQRETRDQRADSGVVVFAENDDKEDNAGLENKANGASPHTTKVVPLRDNSRLSPWRLQGQRRLAAGDSILHARTPRKQASMPNMSTTTNSLLAPD